MMSIKLKSFMVVVVSVFTLTAFTQSAMQTIKGTIVDKQSQSPLYGANVFLIGSNPLKGCISDIDGKIRIAEVAPGRYDLMVTFLGYKEIIIPNVVVTTGKETELELSLEENISTLREVVVAATKKNETNNGMTTLSGRSFSMEEVNRYAGGRSDPARLAANFAGVSTPNDYNNNIVIRGNSPIGVLWRIEGLTVPSPNHFTTLGATGAPLSVLNTNVLRNSDFFTSAFPAEYGNATSGVFDIGLRNGNTGKHEHMVQFGLLTGFEAMTEGPIKRNRNASYLIACRYSFMGFAKQLGIPLGTSTLPSYQDISFKLNSGNTKAGQLMFFGLLGNSNINYKHGETDSTDLFIAQNSDTYVKSNLVFLGLKHKLRINSNTYWNTLVGTSYSGNKFRQDSIQDTYDPVTVIESSSNESKYTVSSHINSKINARLTIKGGLQADIYNLNLRSRNREYSPNWNYLWDYKGITQLLSAYVQSKFNITGKLIINTGIHSQWLTLNNSKSIGPRIGLKYQMNEKSSLNFGYGYHSQMQPLNVYFYRSINSDGTYNDSNQKLGFTNSQHFVLGFDLLPLKDWRIKTEIYYQKLNNVPVSQMSNSFSMLNEGASYKSFEHGNLTNKGTGKNYGMELTIEKFFSQGYYVLITGSLYNSKYKGSDNIERNTAFNGKFVYNILAGKEFKVGQEKRNAVSIDYKLSHAGGRYYTPVDINASQIAHKEVLMGDNAAFTQRIPDFFRIDMKIGFTHNSKTKKITHSLFYDFQNITNHKNVFAQMYNKDKNQVSTAYQIGFMPNFVYKMHF